MAWTADSLPESTMSPVSQQQEGMCAWHIWRQALCNTPSHLNKPLVISQGCHPTLSSVLNVELSEGSSRTAAMAFGSGPQTLFRTCAKGFLQASSLLEEHVTQTVCWYLLVHPIETAGQTPEDCPYRKPLTRYPDFQLGLKLAQTCFWCFFCWIFRGKDNCKEKKPQTSCISGSLASDFKKARILQWSDGINTNTEQKFEVIPLVPISGLSRPHLPQRTVLQINLNALVWAHSFSFNTAKFCLVKMMGLLLL